MTNFIKMIKYGSLLLLGLSTYFVLTVQIAEAQQMPPLNTSAQITHISPTFGPIGTTITIYGQNLKDGCPNKGSLECQLFIYFGNASLNWKTDIENPVSWNNDRIIVKAPKGAFTDSIRVYRNEIFNWGETNVYNESYNIKGPVFEVSDTSCTPGKLKPVGAVGDTIPASKGCLSIGTPGNSYNVNSDGSVYFMEPVSNYGKQPGAPSAYFPIIVNKPGIYGTHLTVRGYDSQSDSFLIQIFDPEGKEILFPGPVASANAADVRFENASIVSGKDSYSSFTTIRGNHWQVYDDRPKQFIPMVTWNLPSSGVYTLRVIKREDKTAFSNVRLVDNTIDSFVREKTWEESVSPIIIPVKIEDIEQEASNVKEGKITDDLNLDDENVQKLLSRAEELMRKIKALEAELANLKSVIKDFIAYGTPTTQRLGAGERAGVVASFQEAFGKTPEQDEDWEDVIKIANGRWPSQRNEEKENQAEKTFLKIYQRLADRDNNPKDDAAVTIMAYGLRPSNRNLASETTALKYFKAIFGKYPSSAADWDAMRAISYSGAKR